MALIVSAIYCTEENERIKYTKQFLDSILETVDFTKHRLYLSDNGSCEEMQEYYDVFRAQFIYHYKFPIENLTIEKNGSNLGTAKAVNKGWSTFDYDRDFSLCKMDDDMIIHKSGWVDEMERAIRKSPNIGILGLKRNDLEQYPDHPTSFFKTELIMLPHEKGEEYIIVEKSADIMGSIVMINKLLFDKIGYYEQPAQYGYEDSLYSFKSLQAGFINCFLPHIPISHIDTGENVAYREWKQLQASQYGESFAALVAKYRNGELYYKG